MFKSLLTFLLLLPCTIVNAQVANPAAPSSSAPHSSPASPLNLKSSANLYQYGMIAVMVLIFYFLLFRPQRTQMKQRQEMLSALKVGDKIITSGGIYGEIVEIKDKSVRVKIAKDVILRMDRSGIQSKTTQGNE